MRVTITNTGKAPQGVHTTEGLRTIRPSASRTVTVAQGYEDRVKGLPFFKVEVLGETATVQPVQVAVDTRAGTGELIQEPTVDATTGEPIPPVASVTGEVAETFDAELLSAATDAELAEMHEKKFGKPPHHAAKRETIIAKLASPAEA